jgi:hypothetical protein
MAGLDWLSEEDKIKIFHDNPVKVIPRLAAM